MAGIAGEDQILRAVGLDVRLGLIQLPQGLVGVDVLDGLRGRSLQLFNRDA